MRVLLETENALVGFEEKKRAIVVNWSGRGDFEEFSLVYNQVLKGFKIFFINILINDMGEFGQLKDKNLEFLACRIFPMLAKCGMRKFISINLPHNELRKLTDSFANRGFNNIIVEEANNSDSAFENITTYLK